jgi:hypothetical protein
MQEVDTRGYHAKMCQSEKLKGTVARDNFYSTFVNNHLLLILLEVLYEDFIF